MYVCTLNLLGNDFKVVMVALWVRCISVSEKVEWQFRPDTQNHTHFKNPSTSGRGSTNLLQGQKLLLNGGGWKGLLGSTCG